MSKTAILFTTYYISPVKEGVFSKEAVGDSHVLTGEKIIGLLWKRLVEDKEYQKNHLLSCIKNPESISKPPVDPRLENPVIKELLAKYNIIPSSDSDWTNLLLEKMLDENESEERVCEASSILSSSVSLDPIISLENKNFPWLLENILPDKEQAPFSIYNSENFRPGQWLYDRFCYYELKQTNQADVSVYAIWALKPSVNEAEWIEALTEQVLQLSTDTQELFLVLHNKDIGDSTFKVIESANTIYIKSRELTKNRRLTRTVAVFAHVDEIGRLLERKGTTPQDIRNLLIDKCLGREKLLSLEQNLTLGHFESAKKDIDDLRDIKTLFYEKLSPKLEMIMKLDKKRVERAILLFNMIHSVNQMIKEFENEG